MTSFRNIDFTTYFRSNFFQLMTSLAPHPSSVEQRIIEYNVPLYYTRPPPLSFREGSALQIQNQTHRADLNGKYVVCLGRDGMRTLVMNYSGDTLSIADTNLQVTEIVSGSTRVSIVGLESEPHYNGRTGIADSYKNGLWTIKLEPSKLMSSPKSSEDAVISVKPINMVITPMGSDEPSVMTLSMGQKKRRLISNLVSSSVSGPSAPGGPKPLSGSVGLLSGHPIPGAASRLMAIDASVAMNNQQPILKRCGTLRKLVHGFPGFAQLVICVVVKLHLDPSHPGRVLDPPDVDDAMNLANVLTDGKLDGIPRRDLKELVAGGVVSLEQLLRIADRYCGANHLVFAIDSNFAGIKETITTMIQQITTGGTTNVAVASSPPVAIPEGIPNGEAAAAPILPFNEALTQLMKNRYAAVKTAVAATNDNPESMDVDK